jgi:hypothetical protein
MAHDLKEGAMSAEILRKAAALMRERAEAATSGPWALASVSGQGFAVHRGEHTTVSLFSASYDAEHIASWHPAVALAVADWLEAEAVAHSGEIFDDWDAATACCRMPAALAVARAYLGEDA